jgi:uncharacterized protein (DUF58 family)
MKVQPASASTARTDARRIYILPTRAGLVYGLILFATLLGSLNYQNNLGLLLTFVMISMTLVSMHHCWFQLLNLKLTAADAAPVYRGQLARFPVSVTDLKGRPRPGLRLSSGPSLDLPAFGTLQTQVEIPATRRGELPLGQLSLSSRYPFGLFRTWTNVPLRAAVLVYPKPAQHAPAPASVIAMEHGTRGAFGVGADDFVGPRPYRPGDSPRQLDWKALARERGLVVKQFGGDQSARTLVDWHGVDSEDDETRLSLLARQVLDSHARGLIWALRLPQLEIGFDSGEAHKHRCLAALARWSSDV